MVHEYFLLSFHVTVISKLANEVSQKICKDALSCHNISSGKPFSNATGGAYYFLFELKLNKDNYKNNEYHIITYIPFGICIKE